MTALQTPLTLGWRRLRFATACPLGFRPLTAATRWDASGSRRTPYKNLHAALWDPAYTDPTRSHHPKPNQNDLATSIPKDRPQIRYSAPALSQEGSTDQSARQPGAALNSPAEHSATRCVPPPAPSRPVDSPSARTPPRPKPDKAKKPSRPGPAQRAQNRAPKKIKNNS